MKLSKLYEMQRLLDEVILNNFIERTGNKGSNFLTEKILALQTEVSELANETKCFKYWSTKQNQYDKQKVLKEYVDILHFYLSIGNILEFTPEEVEKAYLDKNEENYLRQITGY